MFIGVNAVAQDASAGLAQQHRRTGRQFTLNTAALVFAD